MRWAVRDKFILLYYLFFHPGEVVEIRILGAYGQNQAWEGRASGVVSGFFDNAEDFATAVLKLEQLNLKGIYFTLHPGVPALIARACNRMVSVDKSRPLTGNSDIACIRWLLVDVDPIRPAGISSSDSELAAAKEVAEKVVEFLEGQLGFAPGIWAMSGNGFHLLYRVSDLQNCPEIAGTNGLMARMLAAIQERCGSSQATIDQKVFNAGRICKLYKTWARKGDDTEERPHRRSYLRDNTPKSLADVEITDLATLTLLAEMAPTRTYGGSSASVVHSSEKERHACRYDDGKASSESFNLDIPAYLAHYGIKIHSVKQQDSATFYTLNECLFDPSHRAGESAIVVSPHYPYLTYQCFHDSDRGRIWKDARERISGNDSLAPFCISSPKPRQEYRLLSNQAVTSHLDQGTGESPLLNLQVASEKGIEVLEGDTSQVPHPNQINPYDFFASSGKRASFKPDFLGKYLQVYCAPLRHTAGIFWHYRFGVWRHLPRYEIEKIVVAALKELIQPAWLKGALQLLAARVNQEEELWNPHPDFINVKNGMIDLKNMSLQPHGPNYQSRVQLPVAYEAVADCPFLKKALREIFPEPNGIGQSKTALLQEFLGYILLQTCRFEKALFMYGTGANGKSTILTVVELLVGKENISSLSFSDLGNRFAIPCLQNKLVNIASEVDTQEKTGTEVLKQAISGDLIGGELKYGERVTFTSRVKFMYAMNTPPTITDKAHGFARKIIVLNFNRRFQEAEMDRYLSRKLASELPGILNWALEGAKRLVEQDGFSIDKAIEQDTAAFMASMNPFLVFIKEACLLSENVYIPKKELFQHYRNWCADTLYKPMAMGKFYEQVLMNCPEVRLTRHNIGGAKPHCFVGISKHTDWAESINAMESGYE